MNIITIEQTGKQFCLDCERRKSWQQGCIIWKESVRRREIKIYKPFGYLFRIMWSLKTKSFFKYVYTEEILPLAIFK